MIAWLATLALVTASSSVTYDWDPPSIGDPDHYIVMVIQPGEEDVLYTTTQPAITFDVVPGSEVRLRVAACADGFCGAWSRISAALTINLSADLNDDGMVGLPDYFRILGQMGLQSADDLTGDGVVGLPDVTIVGDRLGDCIGPVSVDGQDAEAYLPCELVGP